MILFFLIVSTGGPLAALAFVAVVWVLGTVVAVVYWTVRGFIALLKYLIRP